MKTNPRHIETVSFWCRHCWTKGALNIEWQQLEGKTLEDIRLMCNTAHGSSGHCKNPDVRLGDATKTKRRRR